MIEPLDEDMSILAPVVRKVCELVDHINALEEKLLSAEERMEAEDIKEANKVLKRDKFVDLPETFGGIPSGPELDPGININKK